MSASLRLNRQIWEHISQSVELLLLIFYCFKHPLTMWFGLVGSVGVKYMFFYCSYCSSIFYESDSYPVRFGDLTVRHLRNFGLYHERKVISTQVWEPYHVTIKCNPSPSPEGWWWRLSVRKFFQSHSNSSRTPLNSSQLHSIHVEKLWDSSESFMRSSSCQNLYKSKV